jgi:UPF0755 protein
MRRFFIFFALLALLAAALILVVLPRQVAQRFGPPADQLAWSAKVKYSLRLFWYGDLLLRPRQPAAGAQPFHIEPGETVDTIVSRLESSGLILSAGAMRDYLIYKGMDTSIQAGEYQLSPALSMIEIARQLQDATPQDVRFGILPGWRLEEIAASLPTSGLGIAPEAFLTAAQTPPLGFDFLVGAPSVEGFLYPDVYLLPRQMTASELIVELVRNFTYHLSPELLQGFQQQGLSVYQAVTLASIVQREAVREEEAPLIASVYLNRLHVQMKLDADPTVQYALGYNPSQNTWWTNPLSAADLQIDSPYNTYRYVGLPPTPISNPGLTALRAVAFPAQTAYYFFRARCDGSGFHEFAQTFEEHLQNACP